jgi:AbrB family looped-hinge helix DNA binding protein
MRITSKGQVTIPKHIREKLRVMPGDEVEFREEGQAIIIKNRGQASAQTPGEALIESLRALGRKHLIVDELSQQTVDEVVNDLRGYGEDADDPGFKRPA